MGYELGFLVHESKGVAGKSSCRLDGTQVDYLPHARHRPGGGSATGAEKTGGLHAAKEVDLLLTEVKMYKITGTTLAERLKEIKPGLRVLYMSDRAAKRGFDETAMLIKPFTMAEISGRVKQALDRPKTMAAATAATPST
jgi:DNA-binding response OmpR family regulator